MSSEPEQVSASDQPERTTPSEELAAGWELTRQSMAVAGMTIPGCIRFHIDGRNHIRATRVAELDELAIAIGAIDEDIGSLAHGVHASVSCDADIARLRREKAALIELQKRASRSGCSGSTTIIEALFPDIPVRKRTASEKAEIEKWLAIRKEAGLKIDPDTAELDWTYVQTLDPYGVADEWELREEFHQVGREYFARSPGSDLWVHFDDLPEETQNRLWARQSCKPAFPAGQEGLLEIANKDLEVPF